MEAVRSKLGLNQKDTNLRPDEEDLLFEEKQKEILANHKYIVLESKLAPLRIELLGGRGNLMIAARSPDEIVSGPVIAAIAIQFETWRVRDQTCLHSPHDFDDYLVSSRRDRVGGRYGALPLVGPPGHA